MPTYVFSCPICRKQYKLTPKDPATLAQKLFTCPNCRYSAPFPTIIKELAGQQPVTHSEATPGPVMPAQHSHTKVADGMGAQAKAYLAVVGSNAKFVLNNGMYVLGRRSSDSGATLQLAPDISMSRQHARLAVQNVGGRLMAQIVCLKANNPIFVNGKMYVAGQPCTLKPGDRLQLGNTRIVFSI